MKTTHILLIILVIIVSSCEGVKYCTSTLINETTKVPVSGAQVNYLGRKDKIIKSIITDSTGIIVFNSGLTGYYFGGPKFKYQIVKDGFEQLNGNEKYPSPELIFKPKIHVYNSTLIKTWYINKDTCVIPEKVSEMTFKSIKTGDNYCSWEFNLDSTLNIACANRYDGVYLKGGKWKLEDNMLRIGDFKYNIVKITESELTINKIK